MPGYYCAVSATKTTIQRSAVQSMVLSTLSQNRAMEGDAVLDRVVQLERLVMEKFAEMKADNQELRQTLQEMGLRLASANQGNSQQAAAGHHDAISADAPAEREIVDVVVKKEEGASRKGPQMGEDESQSSVVGRASAARAADKEMGGGPAEKAKKGASVSRRVAKEFLDEGIRQNSRESNGEAKNAGG